MTSDVRISVPQDAVMAEVARIVDERNNLRAEVDRLRAALREIEEASRTPGTASGHIGFLARRALG